MSDGIVFRVTNPLLINIDQFGRFIKRSGGEPERRIKERAEELAERIRNATPVETGSLRQGVHVTSDNARADLGGTTGGQATVAFVVRISALQGAAEISNGERLAEGREYATYVNDRYDNYIGRIAGSFR